jgi:hypothetical protein
MSLTDGISQKRLRKDEAGGARYLPCNMVALNRACRAAITSMRDQRKRRELHLEFFPTSDPYAVVAKDIGGRFRFKVVMMQKEQHLWG